MSIFPSRISDLERLQGRWTDSASLLPRRRCTRSRVKGLDMVRVLLLGDLHCGHWSGLTHPDYRVKTSRNKRWAFCEKLGWDTYLGFLEELQPIDVLLLGGDLIDGRQEKQGGQELLASSVAEQCQMAIKALRPVKPRIGVAGVYGTPYHTGKLTDDEDTIFAALKARACGDVLTVGVEEMALNLKHKIGNTNTPTGGDIALRKEMLWTQLWAQEHGIQVPNLLFRWHVHRYRKLEDVTQTIVTCPSLQMWTSFGGRQCSGLIHWGMLAVDIEGNQVVQWHRKTLRLEAALECQLVQF